MANYPYTPLYYGTPVFVRYYDYRISQFQCGIAYHQDLIMYDGEVIALSTCIIEAQARGIDWDDAVIECVWRDLNDLR